MMYIYNPKQQPFGLLSNNAETPFNLDGEQWMTVTGYVYINMFKTKDYQQKMLEQLVFLSPYDTFIKIKSEEDATIYKNAIEKAQLIRFKQNKTLRDYLFGTGDATIVYRDDPATEEFLTQYRGKISEDYRNALWDNIRNIAVSKTEAASVIKGVEQALEKNIDIADDLTYKELLPYSSGNVDVENIYYNHPALATINKMIPLIKKNAYIKIYANQVERFKDHLLDVQLDNIIASEYPDVPEDRYERQKHQQITKESPENLKTYKNQLFLLYERNGLDKAVKDKLRFVPNKDLLKEIEIAAMNQGEGENMFRLDQDSPLLPHFPENVTIDGKMYRSCVHYAYHILFEFIGQSHINVNDFSSGAELVGVFQSIETQWTVDNITKNNEKAQVAKFSNPTLAQLLLLTENDTLIWDDRTDPVLGSAGENRAGVMMEHLRVHAIPSFRKMDSIISSIFFTNWMIMRADDYKTTLEMIEAPTTEDLVQIYMCPTASSTRNVPEIERLLLKIKGKLTPDQIKIIWPLFSYQLDVLRKLNEQDAMKAIVYAQYKLDEKPSTTNTTNAKKTLDKVYNVLASRIKPDISKELFIDTILRKSWNRTNYWS